MAQRSDLGIGELAWMAGVIDLKGKVIRKKNQQRADNSPQVVLAVECKDFSIIQQMSKMTGTNPEMMRVNPTKEFWRRGCIEHCPDSHVHNTTDFPQIARWTITGAAMGMLLWNLLPFLRSTAKPYGPLIQDALRVAVLSGRGSGATVKSIRRLEGLGWTIPPQLSRKLVQGGEDLDDDDVAELEVG